MPIKANTGGFSKKRRNAIELLMSFGAGGALIEDMADFVQQQLYAVELNFEPVGIVTGMLRRSYSKIVRVDGDTLVVTSNRSIANYAEDVAKRIERRFGKSYVTMTVERITPIVNEAVVSEVKRATAIINAGGNYKYRNPFPIVAAA